MSKHLTLTIRNRRYLISYFRFSLKTLKEVREALKSISVTGNELSHHVLRTLSAISDLIQYYEEKDNSITTTSGRGIGIY